VLFALSDSFTSFLKDAKVALHSLERIRDVSSERDAGLMNRARLLQMVDDFIQTYFFSPELVSKLTRAPASVDVDFVMVYLPELEMKLDRLRRSARAEETRIFCLEELQKRSSDLKSKALFIFGPCAL
jgi:hypothetical protein